MNWYKRNRHKIIEKIAYRRYRGRGHIHGKDKEDYYETRRAWLLKWIWPPIKSNFALIAAMITTVILIIQIIITSSNFTSLNRPFVELEIVNMLPDPEGKGEDRSQVWCELMYRIKNFGPVPAYNVHIPKKGLRIRSRERGEFNENDIPGLQDFKIGWLAPNSTRTFWKAIKYTDAKASVEKYINGTMPLEITFRVDYDGPSGMLLPRHYWYQSDVLYLKRGIVVLNTDGK